ncbi:hypothetical protein GLDPPO_GLDPPO_08975, partial [Dysosmobacter welbionis]
SPFRYSTPRRYWAVLLPRSAAAVSHRSAFWTFPRFRYHVPSTYCPRGSPFRADCSSQYSASLLLLCFIRRSLRSHMAAGSPLSAA